MRVCIAHMERAVTTLKDIKDGAEYDLCQQCLDRIMPIINGERKPGKSKKDGKL